MVVYKVKIFGPLIDFYGSNIVELSYENNVTSFMLIESLNKVFKGSGYQNFVFSVKASFCNEDIAVFPEDELAFLPPFAGG